MKDFRVDYEEFFNEAFNSLNGMIESGQSGDEVRLVHDAFSGHRRIPIDKERCSKTFQRIADGLFNKDIKDRRLRISFHSLRHTFGTHVYENSGDLYLTQKALGHKTMVMAQRYAKMSETKLREAFTKMSDIMQKGREAAKKQAEQQQNGKVVNFTK